MQKLAADKVLALLTQARDSMVKLASENAELRKKLARAEMDQRIYKVAAAMEEKGILSEMNLNEKIAHIEEQSDNISAIEQHVMWNYDGQLLKLGSDDGSAVPASFKSAQDIMALVNS